MNAKNKTLLISLMDISEEVYENQVFESGCEYLEKILSLDSHARQLLNRSRHYWAWWVNQWNRRNDILVFEMALDERDWEIDKQFTQFIKEEYNLIHNLEALNIYPSKALMDRTYEEMISELIKSEVHNA